jgi:hypothetical protein
MLAPVLLQVRKATLAERLRTSNSPAGRIQASHRDPSDTYDLEMVASLRSRISAHALRAE